MISESAYLTTLAILLSASRRSLLYFCAIALGSDLSTTPYKCVNKHEYSHKHKPSSRFDQLRYGLSLRVIIIAQRQKKGREDGLCKLDDGARVVQLALEVLQCTLQVDDGQIKAEEELMPAFRCNE